MGYQCAGYVSCHLGKGVGQGDQCPWGGIKKKMEGSRGGEPSQQGTFRALTLRNLNGKTLIKGMRAVPRVQVGNNRRTAPGGSRSKIKRRGRGGGGKKGVDKLAHAMIKSGKG